MILVAQCIGIILCLGEIVFGIAYFLPICSFFGETIHKHKNEDDNSSIAARKEFLSDMFISVIFVLIFLTYIFGGLFGAIILIRNIFP